MLNLNGSSAAGGSNEEGPVDYEWLRSQLHGLTVQEKDDWEDPSGGTIGHILEALESGAPEANIVGLVDEVADYLNLPGPDGDTVLHLAALYGHSQLVSLLLEKGADPEIVNPEDGSLPLHDACAGGYLDIVEKLLSGHVDTLHLADGDGEAPLHCAARGGFVEVVQCLLSHGADPLVQNSSGNTPADEADSEDVKEVLTQAANQNGAINQE